MRQVGSFAELQSWLDSRGLFHIELGLGRMERALAGLGPHTPPRGYIQVVGTNGKGSTCAFLAALAQSQGLKTGLYTSPHFVSPKERILVNGKSPDDEAWLAAANRIFALCDGDPDLTWFEFMTLLAVEIFRDAGVDLAIMEAGLGGRNDATTALPARAICFTPIAMDHADILGPGIERIARDKAGALRGQCLAFSAPQYPAAAAILREEAARSHIPLRFAGPLPMGLEPGLRGSCQKVNAGLALACWRALFASDEAKEKEALARAFIPGRLQILRQGRIMLDGAHNPHGMQGLLGQFGELPRPATIIYACLADKDWPEALRMLARQFPLAKIRLPQLRNPRAANARAVADFCRALDPGRNCEVFATPGQALAKAAEPILITGSLYLLSEFFEMYPQYLTPTGSGADPQDEE